MPSPEASARPSRRILWAIGVLAAASFLPALWNGFVYDDDGYVLRNSLIASPSLDDLRAILTRPYFGNFHPLHVLLLALQRMVFGLRPAPWHAVSLTLHAANAILLVRLLPRFGIPPTIAVSGAAIFAVHPIQVESVAWVSEQKNLLSLLFTLLALEGYLTARASGRWWPLLGASAAYLAALASKVQSVGLLPVLFAIEYLRPSVLPAPRGRPLVRLLPFVALGGLWINLAILAHGRAGFIKPYPGGSLIATVLSAGPVLVAYAGNLLWPLHLSAEYDLLPAGELPRIHLAATWVILGCAALGLRRACLRDQGGRITLGLVWVAGFLLPVMNLVPIGPLMNDRYLYAPLCALGPLLAAGACEIVRRAIPRGKLRAPDGPVVAVMGAAIAALALASAVRSEVWRDEFRLWRDAAAKSPRSHLARYNLGTIWLERGRADLAEVELRAAMEADPTRPAPYKNLGVLHYRQKRFRLASALFRAGIRLAPANYDLWLSLAVAEAAAGRQVQALAAIRRAASLDPQAARPHYVEGMLLERTGDAEGASAAFRKFISLQRGETKDRRAAEEHIRNLGSRLRSSKPPDSGGT